MDFPWDFKGGLNSEIYHELLHIQMYQKMEYDGICGTILGFVHRKVTLVHKINCGLWMLMVDITDQRGPRCSLPLHVWKI